MIKYLFLLLALTACYVEPSCEKVTVTFKDTVPKYDTWCEEAVGIPLPPVNGGATGLQTSSGVTKNLYTSCYVETGECFEFDPCEPVQRTQRICAEVATAKMHDKTFSDSVLSIK